jgi:hypothetical protein
MTRASFPGRDAARSAASQNRDRQKHRTSYGPGSAAHRFAKSCALRCVLGTYEGRQALFVVNLPPRNMAGEKSEGMLFDIGYADGLLPVLAIPEKPVPNGSRAG